MLSLTIIAVIAIALVAALLIGIVLIQQAKGGGFGVAFGGIGETVFGAHAASHLVRVTVTLMILFFVLIIGMALIITRGHAEKTAAESMLEKQVSAEMAADSMPVISALPIAPAVETVKPDSAN